MFVNLVFSFVITTESGSFPSMICLFAFFEAVRLLFAGRKSELSVKEY